MIDSKKEVRLRIKEKSKNVSPEEKRSLSDRTLFLLENDPVFITARNIAIFWSMEDEIFTHSFIEKWATKKNILLPVIQGNDLSFATFSSAKDLQPDEQFGIPEPEQGMLYQLASIDLIIVPGIAFDQNNNRLGRGKGFYDRTLKESTCPTIGLCYPYQYLKDLPTEAHDIKVDKVLYA